MISRTKGGLNTKLHAVCDALGRPISLWLTAGQVSDHKGAQNLLPYLTLFKHLLADKGYDSQKLRRQLVRGATPPPASPADPTANSL